MATLQEQLAAINEALATTEKQAALGSQQVTYRSINELIAAKNEIMKQIQEAEAVTSGARTSRQTNLFQCGRGY